MYPHEIDSGLDGVFSVSLIERRTQKWELEVQEACLVPH